jgi:hypothetical protein
VRMFLLVNSDRRSLLLVVDWSAEVSRASDTAESSFSSS